MSSAWYDRYTKYNYRPLRRGFSRDAPALFNSETIILLFAHAAAAAARPCATLFMLVP